MPTIEDTHSEASALASLAEVASLTDLPDIGRLASELAAQPAAIGRVATHLRAAAIHARRAGVCVDEARGRRLVVDALTAAAETPRG
jgi:hypothetical protein